MLISFRFKNCRSFYDEVELSMRAATDDSYRYLNTFDVNEKIMSKGDNELIKSAIIFGGNASGKSNVLKAFVLFFDSTHGVIDHMVSSTSMVLNSRKASSSTNGFISVKNA